MNLNLSLTEILKEYKKNQNSHLLKESIDLLDVNHKNILMLFLERKIPVLKDDVWFLIQNISLEQNDSSQQNTLDYFLKHYSPVYNWFDSEQIHYLFEHTSIHPLSLSQAFYGCKENNLELEKKHWELLLEPIQKIQKTKIHYGDKALYQFLKTSKTPNFEQHWIDILLEHANLNILDSNNRSFFDVAVYYRKNLSIKHWNQLLAHHDFNKVIYHEYNTLIMSLKSRKINRLPVEIAQAIILNTSLELENKSFNNKIHNPRNPILLGLEEKVFINILQQLFQAGFSIQNTKPKALEPIFIKISHGLSTIQNKEDSIARFHYLFSQIPSNIIETTIYNIENYPKLTDNMRKIKPLYLSYLIQRNLPEPSKNIIKNHKI